MFSDDSQESTQQPSLDIRPIVPGSRQPYLPSDPDHSHFTHRSSPNPHTSPNQEASSLNFSDDKSFEESAQSGGIQWTQPLGVSLGGETQGEGSGGGAAGGEIQPALGLGLGGLEVIPEGSAGENLSTPKSSGSALHQQPAAGPSSPTRSSFPDGASIPEQGPSDPASPPDGRGPQVDAEPESDPNLDEPPSIPTPQPSQHASHSPSPPRLRSSTTAPQLKAVNGNGNGSKTPQHMSPISRFSVRSGSSGAGGSGSGSGGARRFGTTGTARSSRFTKPVPEVPVAAPSKDEPSQEEEDGDDEEDSFASETVKKGRKKEPTEKLETLFRSASQGEIGNEEVEGSAKKEKKSKRGNAGDDDESDKDEEDDLNWSDGTTPVRGRATTLDYEEGPTSPTPSRGNPLSDHPFPSSPPASNGIEVPAAQHVPTPPSQPSHPSQHSSRSSISQRESGVRRNRFRSSSPVQRRGGAFGAFGSTEQELHDSGDKLFSSQAVSDDLNLDREETDTQRSPVFQATQVVAHRPSSPLASSSQHLSAAGLEPTQTGSDDPMDGGESAPRSTPPPPQALPPVPIYRTLGYASRHASSGFVAPPPPPKPVMEPTQLATQVATQVDDPTLVAGAPAEPASPPRQEPHPHVPAHRMLSNASRHASVVSVATSAQTSVPSHRLLARRRSRVEEQSRAPYANGHAGRTEDAPQAEWEEKTQIDGEERTQVDSSSIGPPAGSLPHPFLRLSPHPKQAESMDIDEPPIPSGNLEASARQAVEEELDDDTDLSDDAPSPPLFDDVGAKPLAPRSPPLQSSARLMASRLSLGEGAKAASPQVANAGASAGASAGAGAGAAEPSIPSLPPAPLPTKPDPISYTGRIRKKRHIYSPSSPSPEPGISPPAGPSRARKRVQSESEDESSSAPEDTEDYSYRPPAAAGAGGKKPVSVRGAQPVAELPSRAGSTSGARDGKRKRKTTSPLTAQLSDSDESSSAPEDPEDESFRPRKKKGGKKEKAVKQEKMDKAGAKGKGKGKEKKGGKEVASRGGSAAAVNGDGKRMGKAGTVSRSVSVADGTGGGSHQAIKRIRLTLKDQASPASTTTPSSSAQPTQTRVLATYSRHFYPARIVNCDSKGYSGVYYDGDKFSGFGEEKLRKLDIRKGDVLDGINLKSLPKKLEVKEDWDGSEEGVKCWSKGKPLGRVELQYICIPKDTVRAHFGDRLFDPSTAVGVDGPLKVPDIKQKNPSPVKAVFATPSKPGTPRIFKDMVFLLTSGDEKENLSVADQITANGGRVAEDWTKMFNPDSPGGGGFARGLAATPFVVVPASTKASMTPKFMVALAKGIPILSAKFIEVSIKRKEAVKWQPYLVSSGFSDFTQHMMSQGVDPAWGEEGWDMGKAAHAYRPFAGKTALIVTPSSSQWMKTLVPCCLVNLGVADLKVVEIKNSSIEDMIDPKWDYVVVDNRKKKAVPEVLEGDERMGNINWLKQCLIMGEALPPSMKMEKAEKKD
ncbi:hypothetical protein IAT38_006088 [Cryptococcus sp. DSM 104549]